MEKPARYLGGEQGATRKEGEFFTLALCFPDLYEIGMSNNAMRILYASLNVLPSVRCERVFAPAPDFEALLRETSTPLYTLESGIPLREVDIVAFTVGYELCATNILTILDLGGIPLDADKRAGTDPLVIAGGPAMTNPHPLSRFLDAVWIGEAEDGFFTLTAELAERKRTGSTREDILERMRAESAFWTRGKRAVRAVDAGFPERAYTLSFPAPVVKPVQDHGTVEIMRGCPNGCRFCHAGYYYRPQRIRSPERIFSEVEDLVLNQGCREITLASLSSGDYPELPNLIHTLNQRWGARKVSFQLPSLKVESFTLPLLEELAHTRKSGLTFAVETPEEAWQRVINKTASLEKILAILDEARGRGYRLAKFYFMIGLPLPDSSPSEADSLVVFLRKLLAAAGDFHFNVNIGTFIPKPHTPFQWSRQLGEEEALAAITYIRGFFKSERRLKISYHSPFLSILEGLLSRGDERAGEVVLKAWRRGARLDAWEDRIVYDIWRSVLSEADPDILTDAIREKNPESPLPWDDIDIRVSKKYLVSELARSRSREASLGCMENCTAPCGSCSKTGAVVHKFIHSPNMASERDESRPSHVPDASLPVQRIVFTFQKLGASAFLSQRSTLETVYRALQIANLPVLFSEGFNPLPRVEIEDPLPLGMESYEDFFAALFTEFTEEAPLPLLINALLPQGMTIQGARSFRLQQGLHRPSLSSLYWGSEFLLSGAPSNTVAIFSDLIATHNALEGSSVTETDNLISPNGSFLLRLKAGGRHELGFSALFKEAFGVSYTESPIIAKRVRQFATLEDAPVSYEQALNSLYNK